MDSDAPQAVQLPPPESMHMGVPVGESLHDHEAAGMHPQHHHREHPQHTHDHAHEHPHTHPHAHPQSHDPRHHSSHSHQHHHHQQHQHQQHHHQHGHHHVHHQHLAHAGDSDIDMHEQEPQPPHSEAATHPIASSAPSVSHAESASTSLHGASAHEQQQHDGAMGSSNTDDPRQFTSQLSAKVLEIFLTLSTISGYNGITLAAAPAPAMDKDNYYSHAKVTNLVLARVEHDGKNKARSSKSHSDPAPAYFFNCQLFVGHDVYSPVGVGLGSLTHLRRILVRGSSEDSQEVPDASDPSKIIICGREGMPLSDHSGKHITAEQLIEPIRNQPPSDTDNEWWAAAAAAVGLKEEYINRQAVMLRAQQMIHRLGLTPEDPHSFLIPSSVGSNQLSVLAEAALVAPHGGPVPGTRIRLDTLGRQEVLVPPRTAQLSHVRAALLPALSQQDSYQEDKIPNTHDEAARPLPVMATGLVEGPVESQPIQGSPHSCFRPTMAPPGQGQAASNDVAVRAGTSTYSLPPSSSALAVPSTPHSNQNLLAQTRLSNSSAALVQPPVHAQPGSTSVAAGTMSASPSASSFGSHGFHTPQQQQQQQQQVQQHIMQQQQHQPVAPAVAAAVVSAQSAMQAPFAGATASPNVLATQSFPNTPLQQAGQSMASLPATPASVAIRRVHQQDAHWPQEWLEMSCVQFNRFVKCSSLSLDQIEELKRARRRRKNRQYAKRSRERKAAKMEATAAKVQELESAMQKSIHGQQDMSHVMMAAAPPLHQVQPPIHGHTQVQGDVPHAQPMDQPMDQR